MFYDALIPVIVAARLVADRVMPPAARRVLASAMAAGGAILVLRYVLPTALRDAKDVELLLAPMAVLSAAGSPSSGGKGAPGARWPSWPWPAAVACVGRARRVALRGSVLRRRAVAYSGLATPITPQATRPPRSRSAAS